MENLYDYITSEEGMQDFLQDKNYTIIIDQKPIVKDRPLQCYSFYDIFSQQPIINSQSIVIAITERLTTHDMMQCLPYLPLSHHWISLHAGSNSLRQKNMPEENDITSMISQGYHVTEPYSIKNLKYIISNNIKTYNRVENIPLPKSLSEFGDHKDKSIYISGSNTSSDLTIITSASCVDKVASAINLVSQGSPNMFDLFLLTNYNTILDGSLKDSIERTQRVLYIIDHKATEELCIFLENQIIKNIGKDIRIHYLFPQHHRVQSILPDYTEEESLFDRDSISHFIESVLKS